MDDASPSRLRYDLMVDGMTCAHCVEAIRTELSAVPDVIEVFVAVPVEGRSTDVTAVAGRPLSLTALAAAVREAGYDLASPAVLRSPG